ncbi:hypothetical protein GSI_14127 [Ganoderma sinense ZZ0214-1]|uniref:F-box domain-containing protein n=1 Tax=Ganoderma sinense ZZ0214-1 TaxID=1077348 RepID=A0A2G8RS89_9APHY|nr:hypothetical protein GSI_14127 [Ganoderma sinense ZZ0214-1]
MEHLAMELLLEIFDLACADDALAARSLSLVSRRVHEASRPFRFRIVSLYATTANLQAFIHSIGVERKRSPNILPKCRHLFLQCPNTREWGQDATLTLKDALMSTSASLDERYSGILSYSERGRTSGTRNQWTEHLSSLLDIVAQDLETFTLVAGSDLDGSIFPSSFPALRELSVVARGFPLDFDPNTGHRYRFPSLRHFHFASLGDSEKSPGDLATLIPRAPKLTHLRISHLPRQRNLSALIRLYRKDGPHTAFANLERVLIQPVPPSERCGPSIMYCDFVTRLWCSARPARVPVYLVPGDVKLHGADHQAFVRKAKEEWQDRIAGGEGCWVVKEDWVNRSDVGHVVPWHLLLMGQPSRVERWTLEEGFLSPAEMNWMNTV